jgi:hypothetical protein
VLVRRCLIRVFGESCVMLDEKVKEVIARVWYYMTRMVVKPIYLTSVRRMQ